MCLLHCPPERVCTKLSLYESLNINFVKSDRLKSLNCGQPGGEECCQLLTGALAPHPPPWPQVVRRSAWRWATSSQPTPSGLRPLSAALTALPQVTTLISPLLLPSNPREPLQPHQPPLASPLRLLLLPPRRSAQHLRWHRVRPPASGRSHLL